MDQLIGCNPVCVLYELKNLHIGDLGIKNIMEACAAQRLVHFTTEELQHLPNGSGSRDFWILTKLDRATTTTTVRGLVERITHIDVRYPGGYLKFMPADLHFVPTHLDERWMQYWACAQCRILRTLEGVLRCADEPVPSYLRPTKELIKEIAVSWS